MAKKILILCTGNSCRSQMAEGFLKSFDPKLEVYSAGTKPSGQVHPKAVQVMQEAGISLSGNYPKSADRFIHQTFDYVITVCGHAQENCPVFTGKPAVSVSASRQGTLGKNAELSGRCGRCKTCCVGGDAR